MISENLRDQWIEIPGCDRIFGIDASIAEDYFNGCLTVKEEHLLASVPARKEFLSGFIISRDLVAYAEFLAFASGTGYLSEAERDGWGWIWEGKWLQKKGACWRMPFGNEKDDNLYAENSGIMPVLQLSWNDAVRYCEWYSNNSKFDCRLPIEEEWEAFADAMNVPSLSNPAVLTGSKKGQRNDFMYMLLEKRRLSDSIGIVWEWTSSWYDAYPGSAPNKDFGKVYRVLRGGSLFSDSVQRTKEFRFRRCPTARSPYYGFRLARSI
jgi:formylglycine-generating enzyme required for sulfatase activity